MRDYGFLFFKIVIEDKKTKFPYYYYFSDLIIARTAVNLIKTRLVLNVIGWVTPENVPIRAHRVPKCSSILNRYEDIAKFLILTTPSKMARRKTKTKPSTYHPEPKHPWLPPPRIPVRHPPIRVSTIRLIPKRNKTFNFFVIGEGLKKVGK